jgi:hypothetical protein
MLLGELLPHQSFAGGAECACVHVVGPGELLETSHLALPSLERTLSRVARGTARREDGRTNYACVTRDGVKRAGTGLLTKAPSRKAGSGFSRERRDELRCDSPHFKG